MWHCQGEPAKMPLPGDKYLLVDTIRLRTTAGGFSVQIQDQGMGSGKTKTLLSACVGVGGGGGRKPLYPLCCPTTDFIWPFALLAEVSGRKGAEHGWKRPIVTSLRLLSERSEGIM